jgi:bifunctional non-homologous end joining protein LigD
VTDRRVSITRPDKILIPPGITKAKLAGYYESIAGVMLRHIARRPLNLERYPDGIAGERIIQQRVGRHFPGWIGRVEVPSDKGELEHVVARDAATLVYLAGQATITIHRWLSRTDRLDRPDQLVFDLDPSGQKPAEIRRAARVIGGLLRELELRPAVMTTGSRGYHVVVAIERRADFDAVRKFARDVAELAVMREPRLFTIEQRKAKREARILIDILRNAYAHTSVAPYAVRPREHGPVATPLHWQELDETSTRPDRWTLDSILGRVTREGDPWADLATTASRLGAAERRLAEALEEARVRS